MTDLDQAQTEWGEWIHAAAALAEVDGSLVDLHLLHELSGIISREVVRPMGPVSAYILGLAVAQYPDVPVAELSAKIVSLVATPDLADTTETSPGSSHR